MTLFSQSNVGSAFIRPFPFIYDFLLGLLEEAPPRPTQVFTSMTTMPRSPQVAKNSSHTPGQDTSLWPPSSAFLTLNRLDSVTAVVLTKRRSIPLYIQLGPSSALRCGFQAPPWIRRRWPGLAGYSSPPRSSPRCCRCRGWPSHRRLKRRRGRESTVSFMVEEAAPRRENGSLSRYYSAHVATFQW